jgi:hypothetical protein
MQETILKNGRQYPSHPVHYLRPGATQAAIEQIPSEAAPAAEIQVRQKAAKAAVERILMADGIFKENNHRLPRSQTNA